MEMPEGWKRTYNEWNSHDPYFKGRHKALDLMKEMAEALEYPEKIGFIVKDTPIEAALKKFKEWK